MHFEKSNLWANQVLLSKISNMTKKPKEVYGSTGECGFQTKRSSSGSQPTKVVKKVKSKDAIVQNSPVQWEIQVQTNERMTQNTIVEREPS